jgi:hypothetical protein
MEALAHESSLHIGECGNHRVDRACFDSAAKIGERLSTGHYYTLGHEYRPAEMNPRAGP